MVKQGSLTSIPYPSKKFDLVFSSEVLEHIPEVDIPKVVRELCRVSKGDLFLSISLRRSGLDPLPPEPPNVHVTVKPREWWEEQFNTHAGCTVDKAALSALDEDLQAKKANGITVHRYDKASFFAFSCPSDCSL